MSRFEKTALDLAEIGYFVFPCRSRGKRPITGTGFKEATRDEKTILTWWDSNPDANIGIACGVSGIVVFDVDSKFGADPKEVLFDLEVNGAPIVFTGEAPEPDDEHPDSLPGVRGAHVFYRGAHPTTGKMRIRETEIRGIGAYVVGPGSVHASGVEYLGELPPVDELPPMPSWLPELVITSANGDSAAPPLEEVIGDRRNVKLASLAGTFRARGLDENELFEALQAVNRRRCRPPLPESEVRTIARSYGKRATAKGKRDPSELSDLRIPEGILEELANAGISDDEIEAAGSLSDLAKLIGGPKENMATKIVKLVIESEVELFHDTASRPYATFEVHGHLETCSLLAESFKRYVRRLFYARYEMAPNTQAVTDAIGVLAAKAEFDGDELDVHMRIAGDALRIVIDVGDENWNAIEITHTGWKVVPHPVKFIRSGAMRPLPYPVTGGTLDDLRELVNMDSDGTWMLVVGWLLAASRPGYSYPLLVVHGEHGSAKTTLCRLLRALLDPNVSPVRAQPRDDVDLMGSAGRSWAVVYDNVTKLPQGLSDALCRLATGGGLSKRMLYTDSDEVILDAMRPVVINGIDAVAKSSDLLDRAMLAELPVIPKDKRLAEEEMNARFAEIHAGVLGALCDVLVAALQGVAGVHLKELPRMADATRWVTAAEAALGWVPGAFANTYGQSRDGAHQVALEASPIGPALLKVAAEGFYGTSRDLLDKLEKHVGLARGKDWPSTRQLPAELKRLAPDLRALGFQFKDSGVGHGGARRWTIGGMQ